MNRISIRAAERSTEELLCLRTLYLTCRQYAFSWFDTTSYRLYDFDRDTEGEYILVAGYDDTIVGFISIWLADNFIHHLYVDANFQNQGIGSLLLNAATDVTGFPVRLKCLEKNRQALFFYTKKGFGVRGRGNGDEGEYVLMELKK